MVNPMAYNHFFKLNACVFIFFNLCPRNTWTRKLCSLLDVWRFVHFVFNSSIWPGIYPDMFVYLLGVPWSHVFLFPPFFQKTNCIELPTKLPIPYWIASWTAQIPLMTSLYRWHCGNCETGVHWHPTPHNNKTLRELRNGNAVVEKPDPPFSENKTLRELQNCIQ
mgnify:CR=1 FL=1